MSCTGQEMGGSPWRDSSWQLLQESRLLVIHKSQPCLIVHMAPRSVELLEGIAAAGCCASGPTTVEWSANEAPVAGCQ